MKLYSLKIFIFLVCLLPSLSYGRDIWTKKDTIYQVTYLTLHSIDWLQTKEIARNPDYHETNPILGKYPSQSKVNIYFLSTAIFHTSIAYYLPKKYRRIWQCVFIGIQSGYIVHNYNMGIKLRF